MTVLAISPHSLAVAEKCNQLKNFLTWYKRSSHTLTTTSYVTCDSAPAVGKKSQKASMSIRKGGRGQASKTVPRPSAEKQVPQPSAAPTSSPVLPPPLVTTPPSFAASPPFAAAPLSIHVPPPYAAPPPAVSHPSSPSQISTALERVPYPSPMPGQFISIAMLHVSGQNSHLSRIAPYPGLFSPCLPISSLGFWVK